MSQHPDTPDTSDAATEPPETLADGFGIPTAADEPGRPRSTSEDSAWDEDARRYRVTKESEPNPLLRQRRSVILNTVFDRSEYYLRAQRLAQHARDQEGLPEGAPVMNIDLAAYLGSFGRNWTLPERSRRIVAAVDVLIGSKTELRRVSRPSLENMLRVVEDEQVEKRKRDYQAYRAMSLTWAIGFAVILVDGLTFNLLGLFQDSSRSDAVVGSEVATLLVACTLWLMGARIAWWEFTDWERVRMRRTLYQHDFIVELLDTLSSLHLREDRYGYQEVDLVQLMGLQFERVAKLAKKAGRVRDVDRFSPFIESNRRLVAGIREWRADFVNAPSSVEVRDQLTAAIMLGLVKATRGEFDTIASADPEQYSVVGVTRRQKLVRTVLAVAALVVGGLEVFLVVDNDWWLPLQTFGFLIMGGGVLLMVGAGYKLSSLRENVNIAKELAGLKDG